MITIETLKRFCYAHDDRPALQQPWSDGEYTFASDGRIMLRVPRLADAPENTAAPKADGVRVILATAHDALSESDWQDLPTTPEKPEPDRCENCDGDGRCNCRCCGDFHPCGKCDGEGKIEKIHCVALGIRKMNGDYLRLMATLPGLKVAPNHGENDEKPLAFKFDGGIGVCAALNPTVPLS